MGSVIGCKVRSGLKSRPKDTLAGELANGFALQALATEARWPDCVPRVMIAATTWIFFYHAKTSRLTLLANSQLLIQIIDEPADAFRLRHATVLDGLQRRRLRGVQGPAFLVTPQQGGGWLQKKIER